ncbi:nuclease-related domain-containing protein [Metabacillus indicus]|uniref:nuclease-related domain-containing protein n=1 Tax=Metabacillus indicus TaxID=246786 RepID=UPI00398420BC
MKDVKENRELLVYRSLNARSVLDEEALICLRQLEKGFQGEKYFEQWLKENGGDGIVLSDLLFEIGGSFVQIDSLFIKHDKTYVFNVKNSEGDYFAEGERWSTPAKKEMKNPLLQLKRSEALLTRLLQDKSIKFPLEPFVVFVNPRFHLYNAPLDQPIIYYPQLNRFAEKLNQKRGKLTGFHDMLAKKLLDSHVEEYPFLKLPGYGFEGLRKGIVCHQCGGFYQLLNRAFFICPVCKNKERAESSILRSIDEYKLLFPEKKITTDSIHTWCGSIKSKKAIRKLLYENYENLGNNRSSYFVPLSNSD